MDQTARGLGEAPPPATLAVLEEAVLGQGVHAPLRLQLEQVLLPRAERRQLQDLARRVHLLGVAAQVKFESRSWKQFIIFQFQVLSSWRLQRGFDRFDLQRPTLAAASASSTYLRAGSQLTP